MRDSEERWEGFRLNVVCEDSNVHVQYLGIMWYKIVDALGE